MCGGGEGAWRGKGAEGASDDGTGSLLVLELPTWIKVGQGPTMLAGRGGLDSFLPFAIIVFFLPLSVALPDIA